jgi:cyclophilin family peptidyl-prolyl cis-trans isomerase/protein-disulfide isomerase
MKSYFCLLVVAISLLFVACGNSTDSSDSATSLPDNAQLASTDAPPLTTLETRDYVVGNEEAYVTILMYGDFQCARCARYARDLEILRTRYPDDVKLIWRHLPDTQTHDKASLAFQAAEAAAAQGKFWDMYALLFANHSEWVNLTLDEFQTKLGEYAVWLGLEVEQFNQEITSGRYLPLIEEYQTQAAELEIVGIPTLLINGEALNDRDDLFGLEGVLRLALLERDFLDGPPSMILEAGIDYQAVIETEKGSIRLDLFEADAPITVNNFVFLAEQGWYNDTTFFLVIPNFYAQAGDPSETGRGYAGYRIFDEHNNGRVFDRAGLVAMAHAVGEVNNASSQFFITMAPLPQREAEWDGQFTIFGEVMEGLEVVQSLTARNAGDPLRFPNPPDGDQIISISIELQTQ